jgi:hypothetical protein
MGIIKKPPAGFPFVAIMYNTTLQQRTIEKRLTEKLGTLLDKGKPYRVLDFTDYYEREFGSNLMKQFFVFREPAELEEFHQIKVWSNALEKSIDSTSGKTRKVNIDPGYLEPSKLILFSTKNFSHRIYCGAGVFAEVTMLFAHGDFVRLPWTYDDYYFEVNRRFLLEMRNRIVRISRT